MKLKHVLWDGPAASTDRDCIGTVDRMLSYAQVEALAAGFAEQLAEHGIGRGDVIGIMLGNGVELIVGILGAWRVGAAATPINPTFTERELRHQLDDSAAKLLLTTKALLKPSVGLGIPVLDAAQMRQSASHPVTDVRIHADSIALVIYTSGSTGSPKGVMLDHANLSAMAASWARHAELEADDRALLVLPLFHVNAICISWLGPMSVGGSTVIMERFSPASFVAAVERVRPTYFSAVPAVLARLVELPESPRPDMSSVRFALCGAAPVSRELLQLCSERFGLTLIEGYGLTEATCASTCNPLHGPRRLGTVGPVLPGQQVRITDEDGVPVPPGTRGEIRISGATVMRGYLGRPDATAETIVDGWLRTGDVGVLDEDGYLTIVDRTKDMIIRGGENLYPKEIEVFLATHPAVLESAVVAAAHPTLGEVPVAYVVLHPGADATAEDLLEHCAAGLMKIKVPARLEIIDALPRNPVGKISKPDLRRRTEPIQIPHTPTAVLATA